MTLERDQNNTSCVTESTREQNQPEEPCSGHEFKLRRWLVSFASGSEWYPAGEFVALNAASAIDRAIEVFGVASDHRAEEIPWDAAPLPKLQ
jgi:hypothetical protein